MKPAVLPPGWAHVTLGDIRHGTGSRVDPSATPSTRFEIWSVPSFNDRRPELRLGADIGSDKQSVVPGTVLVCKINPRINRIWVVGPLRGRPQIASTEWIPFFPVEGIEPDYLRYSLERSVFRTYLAANVSGVGGSLMRVRPAVLDSFLISLAPTSEQRRVVAAIEERLSELDAGAAALQRVRAQLPRYRASVLNAACQGRLVPRETTCWTHATIGELATEVTYGTSVKCTAEAGVPVLRMGNIVNGRLSLDNLKYLPRTHDEFPELFLAAGDILFNRTNSAELVGKCAVYHGTPNPCSFASYLIRVRLSDRCEPEYLSAYLNSSIGRSWIASVVSQQVGQANVSGGKLKNMKVELPPVSEQRRIVAELDRRLSFADQLQHSADWAYARAARLREAILKRAFEGKLVPQDSSDEPAEQLLKRIRLTRLAETGPKLRRAGTRAS